MILIILALMGLLWMLAQLLAGRVVVNVVRRRHRGTDYEREQRAQTLKRIFQSVGGILILTIGSLAVLDQVGIDVTLLLGGAAVFGMAVAFGAQALVKDYFSGIIMLMENQYSVGNVVRIGEVAGAVEDVTLRMTVLRDLEGVAHFIPHGQITTVSNLTHGWSRAVFEIGVGYGENVDKVMKVLLRLANELHEDEEFGPLTIDEPEMLGVDAFGDSAVVIKFMIKTRPLRQWPVKRELLRRIKHEFDALGIEIPFPHRTVYHRDFSDKLTIEVDNRDVLEPVSNTASDAAISR
jgi:small conductance mechanosensitive channel